MAICLERASIADNGLLCYIKRQLLKLTKAFQFKKGEKDLVQKMVPIW